MTKLRPAQKRKPAEKITREVLRENPWLVALIRERIKEIKALKRAKQAESKLGPAQRELDLD